MPASYTIGTHFAGFMRDQVKRGRYASASEVVREGLRLMEQREAKLAGLRGETARGAESGPGVPAARVFAKARKRIAEVAAERPEISAL